MRRTKIIATIGPASDTDEAVDALIAAGVDIVNDGADWNIRHWHRISGFYVGTTCGRNYFVSRREALWRQNVAKLAVRIFD